MPKKLPPRVGTEDIEPTLGELPSSSASNSASTASMAEEGEAVRSDDSEQLSSLSFVDVGNLKGGNFADPVRAKKPVRLHQPPADTIDETFTQAELDDGHTDSDAGGAARPSAADLASAPTGVLHRPSAGSEPSLPHLEDRGVFARGGFGSIHRVNDLRFHRDVAMKVLESSSETSKVRFRLEGQVTAQLQHPNIVPVFEGGRSEDGTPFFTMQLVEGETLKRRAHNMDLHQVLEVMLKVCDAVAYAHARGVIHRDLKPENIMLGDFGQVYVMDWGIALVKGQPAFETQLQTQEGRPLGVAAARSTSSSRLQTEDVRPVKVHHRSSDPTMDRPGTVVGTASYMAPEQAMGRVADIDERTDVFGLGGILYYVITGEPLYAGNTTKERIHKAQQCVPIAPEVRSPDAKVPPGLRALCLRALSKNRDDRPQTVDAFRRQLESLLRGGWWFDTVSFRTDDLVVRDGDDGDCAYIITVGTAEVFRAVTDDDGQTTETVLGTLGPGDVFGETAILTDSPRSASVRATSSMTAMVITRESMDEQFATDSWGGKLVSTLVRRLRRMEAASDAAPVEVRVSDADDVVVTSSPASPPSGATPSSLSLPRAAQLLADDVDKADRTDAIVTGVPQLTKIDTGSLPVAQVRAQMPKPKPSGFTKEGKSNHTVDESTVGMWSAKKVAQVLEVNVRTVHRWAREGALASHKWGRMPRQFSPHDVLAFAEEQQLNTSDHRLEDLDDDDTSSEVLNEDDVVKGTS